MSSVNNIEQREIIDNLIKYTQKMQDTNEVKHYNDEIKCIVCGGNYRRKNRSLHLKSKRHKLKKYELYEKIFDILQNQLY